MPKKRARRWEVTDARAMLDALVASGLSVRAFAQREGLDGERLYRWRRRFAAEQVAAGTTPPTTPALIEIRAPLRRAELVEVVLPSGVTLRVTETIQAPALARLVAALR